MIPETALALAQALRWLLARLQAKRPAQAILRANDSDTGGTLNSLAVSPPPTDSCPISLCERN